MHSRLPLQLALPLLCIGLAACNDPTTAPGPPKELGALPRPLTAAEAKVATSGNAFTFSLFKQVSSAQPDSNVFLSPLSASMALGMTMNGAAGSTYDAMRSTLGFDQAELEEINAGYKGLIGLLRGLDKTTDFRIANSIWYRDGVPFDASFLQTTANFFDARVEGLDFAASASLTTINDWVSQATSGKIPSIIDEISDDHIMFLINAMYFKGAWRSAFDSKRTRDGLFHLADGSTQTVRMMNQNETLRFAGNASVEAVDLLYGNAAFSMTVLVPRHGIDVNDLVDSLSADKWTAWMNEFHEKKGIVGLPKFKLEYERTMNDDLKALGMAVAFDDRADFSRMSPMGSDMRISFVKQKTFVDVNEEGTEAAAATAVGIELTSARPGVYADRPFVFAIRERLTGTILFIGKIMRIPPS